MILIDAAAGFRHFLPSLIFDTLFHIIISPLRHFSFFAFAWRHYFLSPLIITPLRRWLLLRHYYYYYAIYVAIHDCLIITISPFIIYYFHWYCHAIIADFSCHYFISSPSFSFISLFLRWYYALIIAACFHFLSSFADASSLRFLLSYWCRCRHFRHYYWDIRHCHCHLLADISLLFMLLLLPIFSLLILRYAITPLIFHYY